MIIISEKKDAVIPRAVFGCQCKNEVDDNSVDAENCMGMRGVILPDGTEPDVDVNITAECKKSKRLTDVYFQGFDCDVTVDGKEYRIDNLRVISGGLCKQ